MTKQDNEIMEIWNSMSSKIKCDICERVEEDYGIDDMDFADELYMKGWRIGKNNIIRCPNCKGKRIKKIK